ncbi:FAD/NAD(P)-binding domain-containing protein [Xylariomycetidae sp. FL0641]|nr:FAD/NAD(P)-binding domain-containing protein [Xylariomycetidae sp. FL0641]
MASFRAIIVGGGPTGLITAHALAAAKIDYILLERQREIVRYRGAVLAVWPAALRLLDQLGVYARLQEVGTPMKSRTVTFQDGSPISSGPIWEQLGQDFGYTPLGLSRAELIETLYDTLPERATRVRTSAAVAGIESDGAGVAVRLADGAVVPGSVVIGADGVHSAVREAMRAWSAEAAGPMAVAGYESIFGRAPCPADAAARIEAGTFYETHGPGACTQSMRCGDTLYFTLLRRRLAARPSGRAWFTPAETEAVAAAFGDVEVYPALKLGALWPARDRAVTRLVPQEEGLGARWHDRRLVLVGDAAAKSTSVLGMGVNTAANSVAALANCLHRALREGAGPAGPGAGPLRRAFARYEDVRRGEVAALAAYSEAATRDLTWSAPTAEASDREAAAQRIDQQGIFRMQIRPVVRQGQILDFVPFEGRSGTVPWANTVEAEVRAKL